MYLECDFKIYVNKRLLLSMRNVPDNILYLLDSKDAFALSGKEARNANNTLGLGRTDHDFDEIEYPIIIAKIKCFKLVDRLKLLSYGDENLESIFNYTVKTILSANKSDISHYDEGLRKTITDSRDVESKFLNSLNYRTWLEIVRGHSDEEQINKKAAEKVLYYFDDVFFAVAVLLGDVDSSEEVVIDLTDLHEYSDEIIPSIDNYRSFYGKPIVVTEGKTDIEFITKSIKILSPHLLDYLQFLDTDFKPELNAAATLKMAKSFASAGMGENMLFILDNDTAARSAITSFRETLPDLPENFKITQYPDTDTMKSYPTKGPQGDVMLDVNGKAGSIEMYLGRDVLTDDSGSLSPVQWKGYDNKVGEYQAEIIGKSDVQARFRDKVKKANSKDWEDMTTLISHIIIEISKMPLGEPVPTESTGE